MSSRSGASHSLGDDNKQLDQPLVVRQKIEDLYPHEYWLEKYNRMNRSIGPIFDHFNPSTIGK